MERHAAPVSPDLQEEPAPRRGPPVEEERRGPRVQPPVWLRRAGCWRHGENGQGLEDCARAFSLCSRVHPGDPVSYMSITHSIILQRETVPTKISKGKHN